MTIKQLKEVIKDLPDNMDVFIDRENNEFSHSLVESAVVRDLTFSDGALKAKDKVLIITDDFLE